MKNLMTEMGRQGDVLIRRVDNVPATAQKQKRDAGRVVLAYGEVTGHAHALHGNRVTLYAETGTPGGRRFITVTGSEPEALTHEEHSTVLIPPGNYEVLGQREYVAPEIERRVAD